jgi:hypothetical protein
MTVKRKSLEEVRHLGYEALARELGPADFVRFLQQFETGKGNYTEERHRWLDQVDEETLIERIQQRREAVPSSTQGKAAEEGVQADGE